MVAFTQSEPLTRPIRRFLRQEPPPLEHSFVRAAGYGLLALAIIGVLRNLPDIKRYIRLKSM